MNVTGGSTDVSTYVLLTLLADGTDATGLTITDLDLQYVRSGATPAAKVDATALGAANSAHADNQAIEVDATDQPGLYRVDWPDAAFAAGAKEVVLSVKHTLCKTAHLRVTIDCPVNLTSIQADQQSVTDAKDLFDAGYDPSTNKVQGVVLVDTLQGHTANTGDPYAIVSSGTHGNAALKTLIDTLDNIVDTEIGAIITTLGTPAGASISADLVVIDDFVDALEARLTAARAGYLDNLSGGAVSLATALATAQADLDIITGTAGVLIDAGTGAGQLSISSGLLAWNPAWDTEVQSECTDALNAYDPPTNAEMEARTLAAASYATASALDAVDNFVDSEIAAIQSTLAALFTTSLSESYRAAGVAPTMAQFAFETLAQLGDSSITTTVKTLRNLAGTAAKTFQLDDASAPTSITELT